MSQQQKNCEWCSDIMAYARANPVKFFSISSFLTLGGIPIFAFLGWALAAVVASIVGAVLLDVFLISLAAVALVSVLCCVTCASLCATSVFGVCYLGVRAVGCAVKKTGEVGFRLNQKSTWPGTTADPNDS